jgi:hypothetical protein
MKLFRLRLVLSVTLALVAVAVFAMVLHAQTKVTPASLGSGGAAGPKVYAVLPSGSVALVDLGAGLVLDLSGPTPVLKAVATANHKVHVAKPLSTGLNLTLPEAPIAGSLRMHKNGVLWTESEDYTLSGNIITAINGQMLQAGDVLNLEYSY